MSKWSLERIKLPLKTDWKITRGKVQFKENLIITYREGRLKGQGEVSFLTGAELGPHEIEKEFQIFLEEIPQEINGLEEFVQILEEGEYSANLKAGLEMAYVGFLAELMNENPQRILGVRDVSNLDTSMSIPHMDIKDVGHYFEANNLYRFPFLKVKITSSADIGFLNKVASYYSKPLRIDGNECFKSAKECLSFFSGIEKLNIQFVEQPIHRDNFDEYIKLRKDSPFLLMADESLQDGRVIDDFQLGFHGVNIKLSKAGGYYKAIKQIKEARELGLKTMLGCMIETSLGISCAMNISNGVDFFDLDGFLLIKEDPFKLIYEESGKLYFSHQQ
jgi:L-Ala-D/L-Glu epimerase